MPYVLIFLGAAVAYLDFLGSANVTGAGALVKTEVFTGPDPFYKWLGALILIALLGYIPELRPISTAMLTLVILAIVLAHLDSVTSLIKAV